jgi:hypothetical protein
MNRRRKTTAQMGSGPGIRREKKGRFAIKAWAAMMELGYHA